MAERYFQNRADACTFAKETAVSTKAVTKIQYKDGLWVVEGKTVAEAQSETNLVKSNVVNEKNYPKTEVEVEIAEAEDFKTDDVPSTRICLSCTEPISASRLNFVPHALRCAKCQSLMEKNIDHRQYIDEGLAGTREAHKHMRGGLLSDMIKRGKE